MVVLEEQITFLHQWAEDLSEGVSLSVIWITSGLSERNEH